MLIVLLINGDWLCQLNTLERETNMENKELIAYRNSKPHQNKEMLAALLSDGSTPSEVAKRLHISTKLVKIKLKEFRLT
jgi:DNA-binding CsgD family transcriptional regulator